MFVFEAPVDGSIDRITDFSMIDDHIYLGKRSSRSLVPVPEAAPSYRSRKSCLFGNIYFRATMWMYDPKVDQLRLAASDIKAPSISRMIGTLLK
jgi:hypothetical protein